MSQNTDDNATAPWLPQVGESPEAFAAFRTYLSITPAAARTIDRAYSRRASGTPQPAPADDDRGEAHTGGEDRGEGDGQGGEVLQRPTEGGHGRGVEGARAEKSDAPTATGKPKRAPGCWRDWAVKWAWAARAAAWDRRAAVVETRARERVIDEAADRQTRDWLAGRAERQAAAERAEDELADALLRKAKAMLAFGLAEVEQQRELTLADGSKAYGYEVYKPGKWDFGTAVKMATAASTLKRLANQMPIRVADVAPAADATEGMYESRGELAEGIPDGVYPGMPADPDAKPEIGASVRGGANPHGLVKPDLPDPGKDKRR